VGGVLMVLGPFEVGRSVCVCKSWSTVETQDADQRSFLQLIIELTGIYHNSISNLQFNIFNQTSVSLPYTQSPKVFLAIDKIPLSFSLSLPNKQEHLTAV
jgi:hypothetical protein